MGAGTQTLFFHVSRLSNKEKKQPHAGKVEDQFPVIRVDDQLYTMSLRMMKAVW